MQPMTIETFLAWESRQDGRYEFVDGRPVAMTGGTRAHDAVRGNIVGLFWTAMRGKPCRAHIDLKVACGSGNVRYPDALIECSRGGPKDQAAAEPTIVVEVLSPSTQAADFLVKFQDYDSVPTISTYLIFWQDAAKAQVFRRGDNGRLTAADQPDTLDAVIDLADVGVRLALADVYEGVDFPDPAAPAVTPPPG